jgi:hypothetical protein
MIHVPKESLGFLSATVTAGPGLRPACRGIQVAKCISQLDCGENKNCTNGKLP